jgi:hypothetical protein
MTKCEQA